MEFVRGVAADAAGIGLDRAEVEPAAGEDARVGPVHRRIGRAQRGVVGVEGVGVLHQEFAGAHHAETRPDLVAELGLDLVEVDRQLLVALQLVAGQLGDDLLVGRSKAELTLVAILQAQEFRAVLLPATGLLPQLRGLYRRHQDLEGAGAVHLLAHDTLHLAQDPQPQRQPGVQAGRELADHAGTQHQFVTHDLGIGRGLLDSLEGELRGTHGACGPGSKGK